MSSVDFLVKMRDAATMIADACNEELEKKAPVEANIDAKDFDKLFWETKAGGKGDYQQTSKRATSNHPVFQTLQSILKEHNGFCVIGAYKYWNHQNDVNTIDRRKK